MNQPTTTGALKREEFKFFIKSEDSLIVKEGLECLMLLDSNCKDGKFYTVSSIYFENLFDGDLFEKLEGVRFREKYRIRIYNGDTSYGKFEIKRKNENTIQKVSMTLNNADIRAILSHKFTKIYENPDFAYVSKKLIFEHYRPKSLVIYDRLAFYLPYNNIRVTLDLNLRTGGHCPNERQLQKTKSGKLLMPRGYQVLEIKYSGKFPRFIREFLASFALSRSSISKYATSRIYTNTAITGDDPVLPF